MHVKIAFPAGHVRSSLTWYLKLPQLVLTLDVSQAVPTMSSCHRSLLYIEWLSTARFHDRWILRLVLRSSDSPPVYALEAWIASILYLHTLPSDLTLLYLCLSEKD